MAEIFEVGVRLRALTDRFGRNMRRAGQVAQDTFRKLTQGGAKSQQALEGATKETNELTAALSKAKLQVAGILGTVGLTQAAQELAKTTDAWKQYTAQLALATASAEEQAKAEEELFRISQDTRSNLDANVGLYARLARSSQELGLSQEQLLQLTESISQAFQVSGSTAAEAAAATTQLSQGLAAGVLRGDEFNSVMESGGRIAIALRDALGVTTGELRDLAQQGRLTARTVTDALLEQAEAIDAEYAQLPLTIEGSITQLSNAWTRYIGETDEASNSSRRVAEAISAIAQNFNQVADLAFQVGEIVVAAFAVKGVRALAAFTRGTIAATAATTAHDIALKKSAASATVLGQSLSNIGWVAVALEVAELTGNLIELYEETEKQAEAQANLEETNRRTQERLADLSQSTGIAFESMEDFNQAVADGKIVFDDAAGTWREGTELVQGFADAAKNASAAAGDVQLPGAEGVQAGFFAELQKELSTLTEQSLPAYIQKVGELRAAGLIAKEHAEVITQQLLDLQKGWQDTAKAAEDAAKAQTDSLQAAVQEHDILKLNVDEWIEYSRQKREAAAANVRVAETTDQVTESEQALNSEITIAANLTGIVRQRYAELSQDALEFFDAQMSAVTSVRQWWTVLSDREFERVQARTQDYTNSLLATAQALEDGTATAAQYQTALANANSELSFVSEQTANQFRAAVARARQEIESLSDSLERRFSTLQDELDRLEGRDRDIALRRYERERLELEEAYQEAVRAGHVEAQTQAQEALRLLQQVHEIKMRQYREERRAVEGINRERERPIDPGNRLLPYPIAPEGLPRGAPGGLGVGDVSLPRYIPRQPQGTPEGPIPVPINILMDGQLVGELVTNRLLKSGRSTQEDFRLASVTIGAQQ